jgi:hypothetical protein
MPSTDAVDEKLTIDPRRRSSMLWRTTSRVRSIGPVTSAAMVAFQFSSVCSQM